MAKKHYTACTLIHEALGLLFWVVNCPQPQCQAKDRFWAESGTKSGPEFGDARFAYRPDAAILTADRRADRKIIIILAGNPKVSDDSPAEGSMARHSANLISGK